MLNYDWDWSVVWRYRVALTEGIYWTAQLTSISIVVGTSVGLPLGTFLGASPDYTFLNWAKKVLLGLVDGIRALPVLILLLLFYYWLPYVFDVRSPFWLAVIALSVNLSAFIADIFRHAVTGVSKPLVEAGYAVGMPPSTVLRRIVAPEALRAVTPTLALLYIDILKLSSLASVISVEEIVHRASEVSAYTYRFLELYLALAVIYISIVVPFSYLARRLENSPRFMRRS